MRVAETILQQLGGNRFVSMTGAKNFVADGNTLRMSLPRNVSKANRLYITLDASDTYTMRFFHYSPARLNRKTYAWSDDKVKEIKTLHDVYCDQLQEVFTAVTGMHTHL